MFLNLKFFPEIGLSFLLHCQLARRLIHNKNETAATQAVAIAIF